MKMTLCGILVLAVLSKRDGVVKTLHLVRCCIFSIITTYLMYAEIIEKLHASNMKLFEVYAIYLSIRY